MSGLVAALEISPPLKSCRRVQRLEIKSRRGEISRKYAIQGIISTVVWWNDTINDMFNVAASIHDQNLMYITLFKTQVRKWIRITHAG